MLRSASRWAVVGLAVLVGGAIDAGWVGADDVVDRSFGQDGVALTPGSDDRGPPGGRQLAVQPDGSIVLVGTTDPTLGNGDLLIARFTADGSPDGTFGANGVVAADLGGDEQGRSVAVQSDGRIVVAGTTWDAGFVPAAFVARLDDAGAFDTAFGDPLVSGQVGSGPRLAGEARDLVVDQADRITLLSTGAIGVVLARFLPDGAPDPGFGVAGVVETDEGADLGWPDSVVLSPHSMAVRADGSVVVAGSRLDNTSQNADAVVLRYLPDGTLDAEFGDRGVASIDRSDGDHAYSVAVQSDSRILLTGSTFAGGGPLLARLDLNGSLDPTFGDGGVATIAMDRLGFGTFILTQADDGFLVTSEWRPLGSAPNTYLPPDAAVLRFNSDGSPDSAFGDGGLVTVPFGDGTSDSALAAAIQSDERIILSGMSESGQSSPGRFLAVARLRSDPEPVPSTSNPPPTTSPPTTSPPTIGPPAPTLPATGGSGRNGTAVFAAAAILGGVVLGRIARRRVI